MRAATSRRRGIPAEALAGLASALRPPRNGREQPARRRLREGEIAASGLLADTRWPSRNVGAWRDERGKVKTFWARALRRGSRAGSRYLYVRGATPPGPLAIRSFRLGREIVPSCPPTQASRSCSSSGSSSRAGFFCRCSSRGFRCRRSSHCLVLDAVDQTLFQTFTDLDLTALPGVRQGTRRLLPHHRVPLDPAELGEPGCLSGRPVPLLLPPCRGRAVRASALERVGFVNSIRLQIH
jgi:hypothetical protein